MEACTEDLRIHIQLEKLLRITIAYYDGKDSFTVVSSNEKIPLEHVYYQKYPDEAGFYRLTTATCDGDSGCEVGKPPANCRMYCKHKCAVYYYQNILDRSFSIKGSDLINLIKEH